LLAGVENLVDHQVALRRRCRADVDGCVGKLDVWRQTVDVAVDRDRLQAAFPTGTHYPDSDFATIGDENTTNRRRHRRALYYCKATRCIVQRADIELKRIGGLHRQ
jgi:hypothetical protein